MEVTDINQNVYADIFGGGGTNATLPAASTTDTTTAVASTTDTTTVAASTTDSTTETTTVVPDIFTGTSTDKTQVAPKSKPIDGMTGYFEDRIKNKKFVTLKEVDDDGNETTFIPKTAEEFDEVIDLQVEYQVNKRKKELEQGWYQTKSPAWQAVAKYAELVSDPSVLIPFLQGVRNIESVKDVDENDLEGAETIVRTRLESRGEPQKLIDSQIEILKSSSKLIEAAKEYKPIILNEEQQSLMQQMRNAENEKKEWLQDVTEIEDVAIKAIEAPIFGKQKLTKEEKAIVYDMIAHPSEQNNGYGIYAALDKLYDKRDTESMEMLKNVALLLAKKDSFFTYLGSSVANSTAASLHKKLKVADGMSSSANEDDSEESPVITRNKITRTARFSTF